MARGFPFALWKYVLSELWRLILLSAAVLVAVLTFAAAIKPLADGKLTPIEALRFMGFAVIPMLQWALPFAAGFGATLAYHRLSHDNELTAAYAGGVSHRTVLGPAAITGVALMVVILLLGQVVIPRFLQSMEKLIAVDVAKVLLNSIQRGQAMMQGGRAIYADHAQRLSPKNGSGVLDEILLYGVAAVEFDKEGFVTSDATASTAHVWVLPGDAGDNDTPGSGRASAIVSSSLSNVTGWGKTGAFSAQELPGLMRVPSGLGDNPKYLTHAELVALYATPENMDSIEIRRRDLAVHIGERLTTEAIANRLRVAGEVVLLDSGRPVVLRAAGIEYAPPFRWNIVPSRPGAPIEIEVPRSGGAPGEVTKILCKSAGLYPDIGPDRASRKLTLKLECDNATTVGRTASGEAVSGGERIKLVFPGLSLDASPVEELLDARAWPPARLLSEAQRRIDAGDVFPVNPTRDLRDHIARLHREVTSKNHERFAIAAACLVMVLSGAVTAVRLSGSLPLTVYLWSFFPALFTVILINSGQQLTHDKGLWGLTVLWGGVGVLGVYAFVEYWKLARH